MDHPDTPPLPRKTASLPTPPFQSLRVIVALMLREMGSTYGNSPGGYLWAIISPVGAIVIMTFAFSLIVHAPALGTSFVLFYATGYLPFQLFMDLSAKIGQTLNYSRPLLAYPRVTWMDAILARFTLNLLTEVTVFCLIIAGILSFVDTHTVLNIGPIVGGYGMMALLGLGVGVMNCLLTAQFLIWPRLWAIATRPLFIASGVFFLIDDLPPFVRDLLWWNPLVHGIAEVRTGFYPSYHADFVSYIYGYGLALGLIAISFVFLRRGYLRALER